MKYQDHAFNLKLKMDLLEQRRANELLLLKSQILVTIEGIRPSTIIKDTFRDLTEDIDFKENVLGTTISIASGYIAKKMVVGETDRPVKQLLGSLLQMGVTNFVSKNSGNIRTLFSSFFTKKETPAE